MLALSHSTANESRETLLDTLRHGMEGFTGKSPSAPRRVFSSGCRELDRLLPGGGLASGSTAEWLGGKADGAALLSLLAARRAMGDDGYLVVSDRAGDLYAPAISAWGINASRLILLRPADAAEEIWAINQALRCSGTAAVWACLDRLSERDARKLQLAAESGGTLGLFVRPAQARGRPTWADVQLLIEPQPAEQGRRRWRVETTRLRHGAPGKSILLELEEVTGEITAVSADHEPHPLPTISDLAPSTAHGVET